VLRKAASNDGVLGPHPLGGEKFLCSTN